MQSLGLDVENISVVFLDTEEAAKIKQQQSLGDSSSVKTTLNPSYTFDSFVVGSSNEFAHAAAVAVAENPGRTYNPLFIYGKTGLGKTHLMQAIANYISENKDGYTVMFVKSEPFLNGPDHAIRTSKPKSFAGGTEKRTCCL